MSKTIIIDRYKLQNIEELSIREAKEMFHHIFEFICESCDNLDIEQPDWDDAFMHWIGLRDIEV